MSCWEILKEAFRNASAKQIINDVLALVYLLTLVVFICLVIPIIGN